MSLEICYGSLHISSRSRLSIKRAAQKKNLKWGCRTKKFVKSCSFLTIGLIAGSTKYEVILIKEIMECNMSKLPNT